MFDYLTDSFLAKRHVEGATLNFTEEEPIHLKGESEEWKMYLGMKTLARTSSKN